MKKFLIVIIILFAVNPVYADINYLDNKDIQEYKGKLGRWMILYSNESIKLYSKKYNISSEEIFAINRDLKKKIYNRYYFIPFSEKYLNTLTLNGIIRKSVESSEDDFIWPTNNILKISSVLGFRNRKFHPGLDIPIPLGDPIIAAQEGQVIFTGYSGGYGKLIIVQHRNNFMTRYGHNSENLVKEGDYVKKGQIIGLAGNSGRSTGNHLHFELRCSDIPLDPIDFLPEQKNLRIIHTLKNWK